MRLSIFLCFFLRMRLRRFLISEPMKGGRLDGGRVRCEPPPKGPERHAAPVASAAMTALVAVPGRLSDKAQGVRTEAVAAGRRYLEALRRAGAEGAVLLPDAGAIDRWPDVLPRFDGLLLLGGGDVDPAAYGATDRYGALRGVRPDHDAFELSALRVALDLDLPVLAICRGHQVLNVALGGTLHQHISDDETTVAHSGHLHTVTLDAGSLAAAAMGTTRPTGSSQHHQAIDRLGRGLVVTGRADDGVIEAVELRELSEPDGRPRRWVVGVQWHPEDTAAEDPAQQRLFDAFAAACAGGGASADRGGRHRSASRRRSTWARAGASPGPSRSARWSATAARWASSTLPPYLNLARTSVTTRRRPRIARSLEPCSLGSTWSPSGCSDAQLGAEHAGDGLAVDHLGRAGELHGGVVGGGDAEPRVLVADRLPRRRDVGPVAGHAEQHHRVLVDGRPDRVRAGQVEDDVVAVEDELRRDDDRHVPAPATGHEVAEPGRGQERPPLVVGPPVPRVDEHRRIIAGGLTGQGLTTSLSKDMFSKNRCEARRRPPCTL